MVGFTPGPWVYEHGRFNGNAFGDACVGSVSTADGWYLAAIHSDTSRGETAAVANAHLIAAAPDLLAACKKAAAIIGPLSPDSENVDAFTALRDAIAKAEGAA